MTRRSLFRVLSVISLVWLGLASDARAQWSTTPDILDGPELRGVTQYVLRAQIVDYTTLGAPGSLATMRFDRGSIYVGQGDIIANRNLAVGVRTSVPYRTYWVTCYYRGQRCAKSATARSPYATVNFYYTRERGLH